MVLLQKELNKVSKCRIRSELFHSIKDSEMDGSSFHNSKHSFLISVWIDFKHHLHSTYSFSICIDPFGSLQKHSTGKQLY